MSAIILSALGNHVWQSTLGIGLVWLLTLAVSNNRAAVRHWLWLAASVKFLVPFAALAAIGGRLGFAWEASTAQPDVPLIIDRIGQPFSQSTVALVSGSPGSSATVIPAVILAIWLCGSVLHLLAWWVRWRGVALLLRKAYSPAGGRELATLRRVESENPSRQTLALAISDSSREPGVVGILSPTLVWPRSVAHHLSDPQLEGIFAHELCHVRRLDNLAMAVHMAVEALFWFHPLLWWVERRLIEERERACDEEVIRQGHEPRAYAEGILRTCELCAALPPACAAGVSGASLRLRVEAIMRGWRGEELTPWKQFLLATVGVVIVLVPVAVGALSAPTVHAQAISIETGTRAFEVASIKPNKSGSALLGISPQPGGRFAATNMSLGQLIRSAYNLPAFRVVDGPAWIESERFDVLAAAGQSATFLEMRLMMQTLLAERFRLKVHIDSRDQAVFELVMARRDGRLGSNLRRSTADCAGIDWPNALQGNAPPRCGYIGPDPDIPLSTGRSRFALRGTSMEGFSRFLQGAGRRYVFDRTGLDGYFDGEFDFTAEMGPPPPPDRPDDRANLPSIFTVLQEQLGLKLEAAKGPVEVLVIDSVDRPTPD